MDSLILRSVTVRINFSDKQNLRQHIQQLSPLLPVKDEHKEFSVKMASKYYRYGGLS